VYARRKGKEARGRGGGAKSNQGRPGRHRDRDPYERSRRHGAGVDLIEIAADRRLRIAIKPFLDADETRVQLESPDPEARRGAAMKLGHQAAAGAATGVEAAIKKETVPPCATRCRGAGAHSPGPRRCRRPLLAAQRWRPALVRRAARLQSSRRTAGLTGRAGRGPRRHPPDRALGPAGPDGRDRVPGASLASILLLMALGLAIVFGLMGVINMAHGELMALGAYSTVRRAEHLPRALARSRFDAYFVVALPVSFLVAALVGVVLERGCHPPALRPAAGDAPAHLGRLAHHPAGAALLLRRRQRGRLVARRGCRAASPFMTGLTLPFNRLFIIGLASVSVAAMYWLLFRTDTGPAHPRRSRRTAHVVVPGRARRLGDATTFALGPGWPGWPAARSRRSATWGRRSGQNYIVDSFMVVVTGGVGKLGRNDPGRRPGSAASTRASSPRWARCSPRSPS
jgi:urea transport system permease protein